MEPNGLPEDVRTESAMVLALAPRDSFKLLLCCAAGIGYTDLSKV